MLEKFKSLEDLDNNSEIKNFINNTLKDKYNLNYRCHNYFPPPKKPFVINLASLNDEVFQMSFKHLKKTISFVKHLM